MDYQDMQWNSLRKNRHNKHKDTKSYFSVNLKYIKIKHRGDGEFFYSYHHKNFIRTGLFIVKLPLWLHNITSNLAPRFNALLKNFDIHTKIKYQRLPILGISLFLLTFVSYHMMSSSDFIEDELKEIDAVGGFGELQSKDITSGLNTKEDQDSEMDERTKDNLLGISKKTKKQSDKKNQSSEKVAYKVRSGDTLSEISHRFNVSVESIAGSSGINAPDAISVGQTLKIPPKNGFYYKVKKNDRLGLILSKYNLDLDKILAENQHINPDLLEEGEEIFLLGAKPKNLIYGWLIPVNNRIITSGYGWRVWPRKAFHKGLDLKAYYTLVRAAKSGRVHYAGRLGGYGKVIVLHHSGGYRTLYAHLSKIYVKKDSRVARGGNIGKSGNTGYSFGPHLHFEVSKNGRNINPKSILRGLVRRGKKKRK